MCGVSHPPKIPAFGPGHHLIKIKSVMIRLWTWIVSVFEHPMHGCSTPLCQIQVGPDSCLNFMKIFTVASTTVKRAKAIVQHFSKVGSKFKTFKRNWNEFFHNQLFPSFYGKIVERSHKIGRHLNRCKRQCYKEFLFRHSDTNSSMMMTIRGFLKPYQSSIFSDCKS